MVDLPEMLPIAKKYLAAVLSQDDFNKIALVNANKVDEISRADLFINVDSFAEMTKRTIDEYMNIIDNKGRYFFSKNTVCKYDPKSIGLKEYCRTDVNNAIKTGRCLDTVDIFNDKKPASAREKYLLNYLPNPKWGLLKDEIAYPYTNYNCALYKKTKQ
jgi:hypothetical protein